MQADYILDYDILSHAREHQVFLLARIQASRTAALVDRQPLNLSVVLDRSGSMQGDKLRYVKQSAQFLVEHLGASDRFSLVSYDDEVRVDISPGPVVHKDQINHVIQKIGTGGMTNLSGGWLQGCQLVEKKLDDASVNRVLLLTDGLANRGVTDSERLIKMARQKREEGVTTTTMGVGMDFNEDLLRGMALEGGGSFYFIDNPDQAPEIFSEELQDLLSVVGQNLVISLTLYEDVSVLRQLNTYPAEIEGKVVTYRLGDLYADEIKMLLVELRIPALDALGEVQVGLLRFDYDELTADTVTHRSLEVPITVNTVSELLAQAEQPDPEVTKNVLMLRAARAREEAVKYADRGDFETATDVLTEVADAIEETDLDDADLQTEHDILREEAVNMDLGTRRYDSYARKTTTSHSSTATTRLGRYTSHRADLHQRMKSIRGALERGGPTPTEMVWSRGKQLDLTEYDELTIGSADDNDVALVDSDAAAHHALIRRDGDDLYLEDLHSTNGTFANGGEVEDRFRLSEGDVVTVGSVLFRFK